MKVCIHQPVYFPWLGFFHKLAMSDVYVILDDCQASKRSWINRVYIRDGGKKAWLTVPMLYKHRSSQLVSQMCINKAEAKWRHKHIKTVTQQYCKRPFFQEAFALMSQVLDRDWDRIIDLNLTCISHILHILGIQKKMVRSSEIGYEPAQGTQRIVNILKKIGGDTYVCGMGSDGYLEEDLFSKNKLGLIYQRYVPLQYDQGPGNQFLQGLSILDTLSCVGTEGAKKILKTNLRNSPL